MPIFAGDKVIYGKYALIAKKYCRPAHIYDSDQKEDWLLSNFDGKPIASFLCKKATIDFLYIAAWVGLAEDCPVDLSEANKHSGEDVSLLSEAWRTRETKFLNLWRLMILVDKRSNLSLEERVAKAYTSYDEKADTDREFAYFLTYAYGGMLKIDEILSKIQTYDALLIEAKKLCELIENE